MPGVRVLMCSTFPFSRTTSMSSPISGPTLERRNGRNDLGTRPRWRNGRNNEELEWSWDSPGSDGSQDGPQVHIPLDIIWVQIFITGQNPGKWLTWNMEILSSAFLFCFDRRPIALHNKWRVPTSVLEELLGNMRIHCDGHDIMVLDVGELDDQVPLQGLEVERLHGLSWSLLDPKDRG